MSMRITQNRSEIKLNRVLDVSVENLALLFAETGPLGDSAFYFKICISLRPLR